MDQRWCRALCLIGAVFLLSGCPAQEATESAGEACSESDLIAQCPPGSDPLLGAASASMCGGVGGVDLVDGTGAVSGRCLGSGRCVVACQFAEPCPCGVTAITRDGVFCTSCQQAAACGNGICEGGEDPESCPEDCGRQCSAGDQRCAGDAEMEVCDGRGRWERLACPSGEICQGPVNGVVFCRRDDVLVGVDPGEDPNTGPERSERFAIAHALPALADHTAPYDGRDLVWQGGFTTAASQYTNVVAFAPDGESLLVFGTEGARRLTLEGEQVEVSPLEGQGEIDPWTLDVSADGRAFFRPRIVAVEGGDPLILFADASFAVLGESGAYNVAFSGVGQRTMAISADGGAAAAILANQGYDHALWMASTDSGEVHVIPVGTGAGHHVALSHDGRLLALVHDVFEVDVGDDRYRAQKAVDLYDTTTRELTASILPVAGHEPSRALFAPDGQLVAVVSEGGVEVWDLTLGARLALLPTDSGFAPVAFSPDGSTVFIGARRFDARTGAALEDLPAPPDARTGEVFGLRFGPDGKLVTWRRGVMLEVDVYAPAQ